jgi:hypothetical protein
MTEHPLVDAILEPLRTASREYEHAHAVAMDLADGIEALVARVFGDIPAVVCTVCGKLLSPGRMPASHGLCEECAPSFMRP